MNTRTRTQTLALLMVAAATAAGHAQCGPWQLHDSASTDFDSFGDAVGVSGDWAIVGESADDAPGAADCGSIFFYQKSGVNWVASNAIFAGDRAAGDRFGITVAIDGDYAVVGSPLDDYSGFNDLGSVYVYHRTGTTWTQVFNILHPSANRANLNRFGSQVAINGDTIVIGAPYEGSRGAAYVYVRSGTNWNLEQRLLPANVNNGAFFGHAVSVSGDTLAIGAPSDGFTGLNVSGAAWVFVRQSGIWSANAKLRGSDTATSDQFGRQLGLDGNHLIVGAPFRGNGKSYAFIGVGGGVWNQTGTFDGGDAVAISGNTLLVSDTYSGVETVKTFKSTAIGNSYVYAAGNDLVDGFGSASDAFGRTVAIDGDVAIAGSIGADVGGVANNGAAYIFAVGAIPETCEQAAELLTTATGCTNIAHNNGSAPCDVFGTSPDVYYSYTAPCAGTYAFNTFGSGFDTILSAHLGCNANLNNTIACSDDFGGTRASQVTVDMTAGQTIILRVAGYLNSSGFYTLNAVPLPPSNDECTGAMPIVEGDYSLDTCYATTSPGAASLTMANDVWFMYEAGCSGNARISTCGSPILLDTIIEVHQGDVCPTIAHATLIVANDDLECNGELTYSSTVTFGVVAGQQYLVRIGGYGQATAPSYSSGHGTFNVSLSSGCSADYNQDGGVDGSDVSVFFEDWSAANRPADVNCDGGIDGTDVTDFFSSWSQGGC